jgi:predicted acetyltransferase
MPPEPFTPRPLAASDVEQLVQLDETAFISDPYSRELIALYTQTFEVDRMIGVFDGPELVGGACIYTMELSVPGGRTPLAGVSWVSVLPTHRRRGILTSLMRHQLHGLHESGGEAIAGLTASEPPIYGRFGYGLATSGITMTVPRHKSALRLPPGTDRVEVRLTPTDQASDIRNDIFNRQVDKRPGMLVRTAAWNRVSDADLPEWRTGCSKLRTVLAERDGEPVGYALYRTKPERSAGGQVIVLEIHADDPPAYAALLRFLFDIDLTATITFERRPIPPDSPVMHLLMNVRAAEPCWCDALYLRLVDVDRALAARSYATQIDTVIEVTDDFCPWNAGRWRLMGDEKGATCERTTAEPELALAARELGTVFLGGFTLRALADAGLVEERRSGAVAEVSRAFSSDVAPWLPFGF